MSLRWRYAFISWMGGWQQMRPLLCPTSWMGWWRPQSCPSRWRDTQYVELHFLDGAAVAAALVEVFWTGCPQHSSL